MFVKLFSSILDSTVWMTPPHVRLLWITLLCMADKDGYVIASIPGLAKRAGINTSECEEGLQSFLAADPYSKTPDYDGCRLREIPGGWLILNYSKYRGIQTPGQLRSNTLRSNTSKTRVLSSALPEAEAEAEKDTYSFARHLGRPRISTEDPLFDAFWAAYPRRVGKAPARKAWAKLSEADCHAAIKGAAAYAKASTGKAEVYIKHPSGWLNDRRWEDYAEAPVVTSRPTNWDDLVKSRPDYAGENK